MRIAHVLWMMLLPFQAAADEVRFELGGRSVFLDADGPARVLPLGNGVLVTLAPERSLGFTLEPVESPVVFSDGQRVSLGGWEIDYRLSTGIGGSGGMEARFDGYLGDGTSLFLLTCFGQKEPSFGRLDPAWIEAVCLDIAARLVID